ncbi:hypothetical protein PVAND_000326 [Polypedilum vanderplanki]|uniref:Odorant receptor n=1 Tax=Polypedilum vanderplanki TaxID=319348 RepID=A0A9J6BJZ7_POLVA|nr:hypothetical protein PVAND_000326 [Polypedilum vanderplanki]
MKSVENLRNLINRVKSHFVSDQVQNFVLFLDDFFPSENIFDFFGFPFLNRLHNAEDEKVKVRKRKFFWLSLLTALIIIGLLVVNFLITFGNSEKFPETIESFCFTGGYTFCLLRCFHLCYWKRDTIRAIIDKLDQHFPHSSRDQLNFEVHKHQRNLKKLYRICLILYIIVWLNYSVIALFSFISEYFGLGFMKIKLAMPIYFPLDPYQPMFYLLIFIVECSTLLVFALTLAAIDVLFCGLVCVLSLEFDVLAQKLAQIDPESDENVEKKLSAIIDDYNELSLIGNELEEIFSLILLVNVFSSITMLCTVVFFIFTPIEFSLMMNFIPALPGVSNQLFCTCYYGQLLETSSLRVADEAYNCNWHGKNLKFRKMILLTMLRAQKPQKLTGWKFMDIGLPAFYWVLQTTYSYFSFLSGLYES